MTDTPIWDCTCCGLPRCYGKKPGLGCICDDCTECFNAGTNPFVAPDVNRAEVDAIEPRHARLRALHADPRSTP